MAVMISMTFSLFPCRGVETLLSRGFGIRIQFILWAMAALRSPSSQSLYSAALFTDGGRLNSWDYSHPALRRTVDRDASGRRAS